MNENVGLLLAIFNAYYISSSNSNSLTVRHLARLASVDVDITSLYNM